MKKLYLWPEISIYGLCKKFIVDNKGNKNLSRRENESKKMTIWEKPISKSSKIAIFSKSS